MPQAVAQKDMRCPCGAFIGIGTLYRPTTGGPQCFTCVIKNRHLDDWLDKDVPNVKEKPDAQR